MASSQRAFGITPTGWVRSACSGERPASSTHGVKDESGLPGAREGHLAELFEAAGLHAIFASVVSADLEHPTFASWWEPFTAGVGPAGSYVAGLDTEHRTELRQACHRLLPTEPFVIPARAWAVRGVA